MKTTYTFVLEPSGMSRNYKSETVAKREARRQYNKLENEIGGCCGVSVEVYKITFSPYSKTKIYECPEI